MIPKTLSLIIMIMLSLNSIFAGHLSGSINYDGKAMPKISKTQLKMDADPICGSIHKTPVYKQGLIVNDNKTLKNGFRLYQETLSKFIPRNIEQIMRKYYEYVLDK